MTLKAQTCSGTRIFTDPTGTIDDGSGGSNYSEDLECYTLIQVPNAQSITLNFVSFNLEDDYDWLYIYQGDVPFHNEVRHFTGLGGQPPALTIQGNTVLMLFNSDGSVNYQGWTINYKANFGDGDVWIVNNYVMSYPYRVAIGTSIPNADPQYKLTVQGGIVSDNLKVANSIAIGASNPIADYKLTVDGNIACIGNITCNKIKVCSNPPQCDYVFEPTYKLRPLFEIEDYIKQHKHLPEIQSAAEFKETGYNIGDMDNSLLKKIEELTLYLIEIKRENEVLKARIDTLSKQTAHFIHKN